MFEVGNGSCFALETLARVAPVGQMRGQDLERDDPIQARIAGFIHLTHSPGAEKGQNFVWT